MNVLSENNNNREKESSKLIELILNNYIINTKSSEYFNKNSNKFDVLINYLNENNEYTFMLIKQFDKYSSQFYQTLSESHKLHLLDTLFHNLCTKSSLVLNSDKSEYRNTFVRLIQDSKYFIYLFDKAFARVESGRG